MPGAGEGDSAQKSLYKSTCRATNNKPLAKEKVAVYAPLEHCVDALKFDIILLWTSKQLWTDYRRISKSFILFRVKSNDIMDIWTSKQRMNK